MAKSDGLSLVELIEVLTPAVTLGAAGRVGDPSKVHLSLKRLRHHEDALPHFTGMCNHCTHAQG